jgi:hypothetical protein
MRKSTGEKKIAPLSPFQNFLEVACQKFGIGSKGIRLEAEGYTIEDDDGVLFAQTEKYEVLLLER